MGLMKEFKEFALKGSVVDMAIGVIIGAAFKDIVTSFTDNFIKPIIASVGGSEIAPVVGGRGYSSRTRCNASYSAVVAYSSNSFIAAGPSNSLVISILGKDIRCYRC